MLVAFDFDDTLCFSDGSGANRRVLELLWGHVERGAVIIIVTARSWLTERTLPAEHTVGHWVECHGLPVEEIHYTDMNLKGPLLSELRVELFYDNDPCEVEDARAWGVETVHIRDAESGVHAQ
jgi:acid phosphatase class B